VRRRGGSGTSCWFCWSVWLMLVSVKTDA
jgi:hypothetical protein